MSIIPYPEVGNVDHSSPEHPLGAISVITDEDQLIDKAFMYAKVVDADVTDGEAANFGQVYDSNTQFVPHVTPDRSGGSSLGQVPAGVFVNSISQDNFGWIQIRGLHDAVQTESGSGTDLAVGDQVTTDPSNDGSVAAVSAHDDIRLGNVVAASATGDTSVELAIEVARFIPLDT